MRIYYSEHLKRRIKLRNIPDGLPGRIVRLSKEHYFDELTNHCVAIGRARYAGKMRQMVVAYDTIGESVEVITIHPIDKPLVESRVRRGRWGKK